MRYVASAAAIALAAAAVVASLHPTPQQSAPPRLAHAQPAAPSVDGALRPVDAPAQAYTALPMVQAEASEPTALLPAYRLRPQPVKTDLTEAASDDTGSQAASEAAPAPLPVKAIPAPPPGPEVEPNPAVRDPNAVYKGEGARDDDGG